MDVLVFLFALFFIKNVAGNMLKFHRKKSLERCLTFDNIFAIVALHFPSMAEI